MRGTSGESGSGVEPLTAALDGLAADDPALLPDEALVTQVRKLVTAQHRLHAELVRRVDAFDARHLAGPDGFRSTKGWLRAFTRISGQSAHRLVKAARVLRSLPALARAARAGDASADHIQQVVRLADQVGTDPLVKVEAALAEASGQLDPDGFATVCARVRAHVDPDGPDPSAILDRRGLTLSPVAGMTVVRGQLDPEGGAALATALDALMGPPTDGDERSPAQRRADALVELARRPLAAGALPTVAGQRPQVGVLVFPQALSPETLAGLAAAQGETPMATRLRHFAGGPATTSDETSRSTAQNPGRGPDREPNRGPDRPDRGPDRGPERGPDRPPGRTSVRLPDRPAGRPPDRRPVGAATWRQPGWNDPSWLNWVGAVPHEVAQRIACDADVYRIVLDPANGLLLDVGRAHRLVPHWMRKALHARDRGCRWPGCATPVEWTDAHHLLPWADGGRTSADECILLCRHHHGLVHEGDWSIHLDHRTGEVTVTRPGGIPYHLPRHSLSWTGPSTPG